MHIRPFHGVQQMFHNSHVYRVFSLAGVLFPVVATSQLIPPPPAGATSEQVRFVGLAADEIVQAQAREEGVLATADSASNRRSLDYLTRVAALEDTATRAELHVAELRYALWRRSDSYEQGLSYFGHLNAATSSNGLQWREKLEADFRLAIARQTQAERRYQQAFADLSLVQLAHAEALQRLQTARQKNARDRAQFESALLNWSATADPAGESWLALTRTITEIAADNDAKARVTYQSRPPNLTLHYQTIDERAAGARPRQFNLPSNNTERLAFGWYYIWYEVNGVPKSDKNRIYYIENKEVAILVNTQ